MNKHHIVTTINPATAVTCAVKGKFINAFEENLIVCKGSTIEIYTIMKDGIKTFTQFNIYGVISSMQTCSIPDRSTCSLFLLTDQNCFTIVTYSSRTQTIITEGHGILEETNARVTDQPIATIVDVQSSTVLVSAFTGFLFSIPFSKGDPKGKGRETRQLRFTPASIRTNEFDFLSMVSLKGIQQSTIAVLLGEINELKTIKTFKYIPETNEIMDEKLIVKVESTTHTLIAVPSPIGGVLAIGEYIISYHDIVTGGTKELSVDQVMVTAYTFFKDSYDQCILGDSEGYLYLLTLEINNMKVSGISSTIISQVSLPNSIVDLGNNLLYIGSSQGDPCVVRLVQSTTGKYSTQTLHTFSNLGPIVDFCLFDYDKQGKQTMVCCSGVDRDGSLRVVENGIGFLEQYILNIPLTTNIWTLCTNDNQIQDTLIISTAMETIILKQQQPDGMNMREYHKYSALITNEITLATIITNKNHILQVTPSTVRLVHKEPNRSMITEWKPPNGEKIAIAKANASQCVLCYGRGMLVYLDIADIVLVEKCVKQFTDIACISISPKYENGTDKDYVLVGMWTESKVHLLQLPNLDPVLDHALQSVTGPKDVLMIKLENVQYLMILLGDGQLLGYNIEFKGSVAKLTDKRQTMVGTYCTAMYPFLHGEEQKIFITGIRPTIITSRSRQLFFSAVNLKNIYALAPYNDMIILMTDIGLLFGQTDSSQKLHHTKIKLGEEMPNRIQYMPERKSLAVGTVLNQKDLNNGYIKKVGKIQILDAQTFTVLDTYDLPGNEIVESMTMAKFKAYGNREFLFVGTVIESADDPDQSLGRILVFDLKEDKKCELIEATQMPGIVYNMKEFQNSVVACVNGSIYCLRKFQPDLPSGERIEYRSNIHNNVLGLDMDVREDRVLVADLMQSVSVLEKTNTDSLSLKLLAIDSKPTWMTAVKFVNDNVYIGADDRNNVFTLSLDKNRQPGNKGGNVSTSGIQRLDVEGGFHIGSLINRFREGILLDVLSNKQKQQNNENDDSNLYITTESPFTFATLHGSIGTIKTISEKSFHFFKHIQDNILRESNNIGNLAHTQWRSYKPKINSNQAQEQECNYLDGDLLKTYLYMSKLDKQKVIESLPSRFKVKDIEDFINSLVS